MLLYKGRTCTIYRPEKISERRLKFIFFSLNENTSKGFKYKYAKA